MRHPKTLAIVPIYHENGSIQKIICKIPVECVDKICLVADCIGIEDKKELQKTFSAISLKVIVNSERKGVGHALRQGIIYALKNNYEVIVILAGNGKDNPNEIPRLLAPIFEGKGDYVQGSRFLPGGKRIRIPFFRNAFSRLYPFLWTLSTSIKCTDVTNGFRAYKSAIFSDPNINIWQSWLDNYELEYYIHFKVLTKGYRVVEVPVSKTYNHNHKGGYSQISPFRDWWKIVCPLVYLKLRIRN